MDDFVECYLPAYLVEDGTVPVPTLSVGLRLPLALEALGIQMTRPHIRNRYSSSRPNDSAHYWSIVHFKNFDAVNWDGGDGPYALTVDPQSGFSRSLPTYSWELRSIEIWDDEGAEGRWMPVRLKAGDSRLHGLAVLSLLLRDPMMMTPGNVHELSP